MLLEVVARTRPEFQKWWPKRRSCPTRRRVRVGPERRVWVLKVGGGMVGRYGGGGLLEEIEGGIVVGVGHFGRLGLCAMQQLV